MTAPIMRPGGPLPALALLAWRRPEARLLLALGCVPQTPMLNETVPLFLVVQTRPEGLTLMYLTVIAAHLVGTIYQGTTDYQGWMAGLGVWALWLVYLPCLVMVCGGPTLERRSYGDRRLPSGVLFQREKLRHAIRSSFNKARRGRC